MNWFKTINSTLTANADWKTIECIAHVYMLCLLGNKVMPDKTSTTICGKYLSLLLQLDQIGQYSWGSQYLAMLYSGLCLASRKGANEVPHTAAIMVIASALIFVSHG